MHVLLLEFQMPMEVYIEVQHKLLRDSPSNVALKNES